MRANIITNMFFPDHGNESKIDFSLQKITLDPVVASLVLEIGETKLTDNQGTRITDSLHLAPGKCKTSPGFHRRKSLRAGRTRNLGFI